MAKKGKKDTFEKRLKVYSAAAAGVLAIAPTAEAAIHYSGLKNLPVNSSTSQNIDFNGSGPQFRIGYYSKTSIYYDIGIHGLTANAQHIKGAHTAGSQTFYNYIVLNLPSNYQIGSNLLNAPRAAWATEAVFDTLNGIFNGASDGNFPNATGYIGVRFNTPACQGSSFAYGWIHYRGTTLTGTNHTVTGTIIDWAYEDNCQPIAAGASATVAIPTLNQWGMVVFTLLLGGIAARMLRKEGKEES
jgi:hypothetical protein